MRVEDDGPRRTGDYELAIDGRRAGGLERSSRNPTTLEHLDEGGRVPPDVDAVGCHVRYREQRGKLPGDLGFVSFAVPTCRGTNVGARSHRPRGARHRLCRDRTGPDEWCKHERDGD